MEQSEMMCFAMCQFEFFCYISTMLGDGASSGEHEEVRRPVGGEMERTCHASEEDEEGSGQIRDQATG
jgi:hypothetical protein